MSRKMSLVCAGGCGRERRIGPDFYVADNGLPRTKCKHCLAADAAKWRAENPEKYREIYRRSNHRANLKIRFGITVDDYNALVAQSDDRCGICRDTESRDRRLCLDHDHQSGRIRGFLCSRCNLLIGNAADNIDLLERAARYLRSAATLRTSDQDPPVPMLLFCPQCQAQHIDEGEFETRIHTTHACQSCGMVWRPAIVPTVGVKFLPGFKNANTDGGR